MVKRAVELIKLKQGISTDFRDEFITAITQGIYDELKEINGIELDENRDDHLMFLVDYADYRYDNRDDDRMPNHLRLRLNNLMIDRVDSDESE